MSKDQLSFISLTGLMIHNMENVMSTRYSIDEAMNDIISFIILTNYIIIIYYLTSKFPIIIICGKQLKYLNMYLSRLYNIISTDA